MARSRGKDQIYGIVERFIQVALHGDSSLFSPGRPIWGEGAIEDLYDRFIAHPDESSDSFEVKFKRQLTGASRDTVQLAAELLYIHLLPSASTTGDTKRRLVHEVLSWMPAPRAEMPADLAAALDDGLFGTGVAFHTHRPHQLWFLLEFVRKWKGMGSDRQRTALSDPWAFKALLEEVPIEKAYIQRNALLHLVYPDTFEDIVSRSMKERIALRFADRVLEPTTDVDRQLLQIRRNLAEEHGTGMSFHQSGVVEIWQPDSSKWGQFVYWARRFFERDKFDEWERDYKLVIASNLQAAREAVEASRADWPETLKKAFGSPSNLTPWQLDDSFLAWCRGNREDARGALLELWKPTSSIEERFGGFLRKLSPEVKAGRDLRTTLASFLHMVISPTEFPVFRRTPFRRGHELTETKAPETGWDEARVYAHELAFLDQLAEEASARGLELRDRLDAQSLLWVVVSSKTNFLAAKEQKELLKWRGEIVELVDDDDDGDDDDFDYRTDQSGRDEEQGRLDRLSARLHFDPGFLPDVIELLEAKGQVVFHGPPGTGKTYVARELAKHLTADGGEYQVVQFHPSYAYEDFIEGYRPEMQNRRPGFVRKDGVLKSFAQRASNNPGKKFILIMDELNRGNLAKLLGELYFLLEYRTEQVRLQYSDEMFSLPANLWFIGTMNTADRSIALVDSALRRRFYFVPFFPDEAPIEGLLRRWLGDHKPDYLWVADVVDLANERLGNRHTAIGPSYFLRPELDDAWIDRIWAHAVIPYLQEHFFADESRLEEFALGRLKKQVERVPRDEDAEA